jgi:hypothetical protein
MAHRDRGVVPLVGGDGELRREFAAAEVKAPQSWPRHTPKAPLLDLS